jgi:MATE family multidrug resistance protein
MSDLSTEPRDAVRSPLAERARVAVAESHSPLPRASDFRALIATAIPIIVVQVGLMAMGVVDSILVGHVSAADLAAVALGNLYVFGVSGFGIGTLMALDPVIAQAVGARDEPAVARGIQRGLLLGLAISIPTAAIFLPARSALELCGQPAAVVPRAASFIHISIAGIVPLFGFMVLRQSLQALGRMRPIVTVILCANLLNAVLCWWFVFGHGGPLRGAAGAAISSAIGRWSMMLGLVWLGWRELAPALLPLRRDAFSWTPLLRMVAIGVPIGVQIVLEFGVFGVVALLMGRLGTITVAAHQIAINIASFTFMVPLGTSTAAAVLVGRAIGAGDAARARRAALAALACGFAFMSLSAIALGLLPRTLASVYSNDAAVIALAATLIPIAAVFQIFDGLQVVAVGVLRGVGDTRAPMIVNLLGFWLIGFPVSLWLGFRAGLGAVGLWWGFVAGLGAVAIFLLARIRVRMARGLERLVVDEEAAISGSG